MSSAIRIVLVDTSHPGNIGASARAMKNMGLESLVLVRPQSYPHPEATARASAAVDVLAASRVVATVDDAIGDCGLVIGTTVRPRSANWRVVSARDGAAELAAATASRPAAILFGSERNGLANEEIARCQALMRIPAAAEYESLNLAQAVQVVCYEVLLASRRLAECPAGASPALATADEMLALNAHLDRVMRTTGFMNDGNADQLGERVWRLVARALPDDGEVRILRGWLAAIERGLRPGQ